jgi:hypothetical protein
MCTNNSCIHTERGLRLIKAEPRQAVLYTLGEGPLPVWTVHLYCGGQEYYIFSCASLITPPRMSSSSELVGPGICPFIHIEGCNIAGCDVHCE